MPSAKSMKSAVKRGFNNAKKDLSPLIKAAAKAAAQAAKQELKNHGKQIAKAGVKTIFGIGDYHTNALVKGGRASPSFGSTSPVFRRRECLGPVISSADIGRFEVQKFRTNPGMSNSFPWLSNISNQFESYQPISLVFEYVPTSGMSVAATNTALGSVTMASQYNPYAADPTSLIQIQGYADAVSFPPYDGALCGIECNPSARQSKTLLIRNSSVPSNTSSSGAFDTLFDLCEFFIATEGCQAASVHLGQLWVTYEIKLLNPIVPTILPMNQGVVYSSDPAVNTYPATNLFGSSFIQTDANPLDPFAVSAPPTGLTCFYSDLPIGTYQVIVNLVYTTGTNITSCDVVVSGTSQSSKSLLVQYPFAGVVTTQCSYSAIVTVGRSGTTSVAISHPTTSTIDRWSYSFLRIPTNFVGPLTYGQ